MQPEEELALGSAERWLAERGVERHALIVRRDEPQVDLEAEPDLPADTDEQAEEPAPEAATEATQGEPHDAADQDEVGLDAERPAPGDGVGDGVIRAMGYIRSATAMTPISEGRLRGKLEKREYPAIVIRLALEQARKERLVDDVAFAAALVDESLAKGHAPRRIREDLYQRGFDRDLIVETMARTESQDPEAAAFAVARDRADSLSGLDPEKAYRRLVAYLARRGHPEGLARKVARQVLWVEREAQASAEH
ncbi:MAG: regulatory protein [Glaciecola sp.]|jgi:regulatory protein